MQTRNVLFDLDGTLIDSLPGIEFSVDCALAECSLPPRRRELRPLIGPPIRAIFSQLLGRAAEDRSFSPGTGFSLVLRFDRVAKDRTGGFGDAYAPDVS